MKQLAPFILIFLFGCQPQLPVTTLSLLNLKMEIKGSFKLMKEKKDENKISKSYKSNEDILMITSSSEMDSATAVEITKQKKFLVRSLYRDQVSPYPGKVSKIKGCPEEFHPKEFEIQNGKDWIFSFLLKANKNRVYGGCTAEMNYYESAYIFCYCHETRTYHEIKYFTPIDHPSYNNLRDLVQSISCI